MALRSRVTWTTYRTFSSVRAGRSRYLRMVRLLHFPLVVHFKQAFDAIPFQDRCGCFLQGFRIIPLPLSSTRGRRQGQQRLLRTVQSFSQSSPCPSRQSGGVHDQHTLLPSDGLSIHLRFLLAGALEAERQQLGFALRIARTIRTWCIDALHLLLSFPTPASANSPAILAPCRSGPMGSGSNRRLLAQRHVLPMRPSWHRQRTTALPGPLSDGTLDRWHIQPIIILVACHDQRRQRHPHRIQCRQHHLELRQVWAVVFAVPVSKQRVSLSIVIHSSRRAIQTDQAAVQIVHPNQALAPTALRSLPNIGHRSTNAAHRPADRPQSLSLLPGRGSNPVSVSSALRPTSLHLAHPMVRFGQNVADPARRQPTHLRGGNPRRFPWGWIT